MEGYDFTCIVSLALLSALILLNLRGLLGFGTVMCTILVILVTRAECARSEFSQLQIEKSFHKVTVNFKPLRNQRACVSSLKH